MKNPFIKAGFTIAEVALFLGLSGFLMMGIIIGANASISRQRYTDSVNDFADLIRDSYTDVLNVSNYNTDDESHFNGGRTSKAVYGRLIVIGERNDEGNTEKTIYTYDVAGNAISSSEASRIANDAPSARQMMLTSEINASILDSSSCEARMSLPCSEDDFYKIETYNIPWEAHAENTIGDDLHAAILVLRSPLTGSMRTYIYKAEPNGDFNYMLHQSLDTANLANRSFRTLLSLMSEQTLDICVDSDDNRGSNRRDIRILQYASNTSGVLLAELDSAYSGSNPNGSNCMGRGH